MKIKTAILTLLFLISPISSADSDFLGFAPPESQETPYTRYVDAEVISDYRKHIPQYVALCGNTEIRVYEGTILTVVPYYAAEFYLSPEKTLFTFAIPLGESGQKYLKYYDVDSNNKLHNISSLAFNSALRGSPDESWGFFRGKRTHCSRVMWI